MDKTVIQYNEPTAFFRKAITWLEKFFPDKVYDGLYWNNWRWYHHPKDYDPTIDYTNSIKLTTIFNNSLDEKLGNAIETELHRRLNTTNHRRFKSYLEAKEAHEVGKYELAEAIIKSQFKQ
ncbi:MAG: hypothetical protein NTY12_04255 [Candidatus Falkowbacteria bacterium]|nr:hypothetical protein [Candidatus Falkowbacteria bacterium]